MVLIIPKKIGKNITLVFLPKKPLFDMLERHVRRIGLASRDNTCFVLQDNISIPKDKEIISIIIKTLLSQPIAEGMDLKCNIKDLLKKSNLMLRNFANTNEPVNDATCKGFLKISAIRIKGGATLSLKKLKNYEKMNESEIAKIRSTFIKLNEEMEKGRYKSIIIYIIIHIHPSI